MSKQGIIATAVMLIMGIFALLYFSQDSETFRKEHVQFSKHFHQQISKFDQEFADKEKSVVSESESQSESENATNATSSTLIEQVDEVIKSARARKAKERNKGKVTVKRAENNSISNFDNFNKAFENFDQNFDRAFKNFKF